MAITIDNYSLRTMAFFKEKTKVSPLNCIVNKNSIIFLVDKGLVRKAIGHSASNVKYLMIEQFLKLFLFYFSLTNQNSYHKQLIYALNTIDNYSKYLHIYFLHQLFY